MKTLLSTNGCRAIFATTARAVLVTGFFLFAHRDFALPRSPIPPVPEEAPIYHESFDADYFADGSSTDIAIPGFGLLDQSWSGYALSRAGEMVIPYVIPALDSTGYTNIACGAGDSALRFWITPGWSSQSQADGTGPGANAVLLELDAVNGSDSAMAWALVVSPDGNTLALLAQTGAGIEPVLETPISWASETAHCVILDCDSANGTALFVDGALAA